MAYRKFKMLSVPQGVLQPNNIVIHQKAEEELASLVNAFDKPVRIQFRAAYDKRLEFLSQHLNFETEYTEWFEFIQPPLKSMRFRSLKLNNIRILYCIVNDKAFLLTAFKEKRTKSDYRRAIETAQARLKDIEV